MQRFLLICLGGAIGTGARYQLATWVARIYGAGFPRGTVLISVTGSFLIAVVMDLSLSGRGRSRRTFASSSRPR